MFDAGTIATLAGWLAGILAVVCLALAGTIYYLALHVIALNEWIRDNATFQGDDHELARYAHQAAQRLHELAAEAPKDNAA